MNAALKYTGSVFLAAMAISWTASADEQPAAASTEMSQREKISYSLGMSIAAGYLKPNEIDVDVDVMAEAIRDVMAGRPTKLTEQQAREIAFAYQQEQRNKRELARAKLAQENHAKGEAFLASNKQNPGVKVHEFKLPNGTTNEIQYKVITEGQGSSPASSDNVTYSLTARLPDGKEVQPVTINNRKAPISQIREAGVREALQLMKPGAKWEIAVPASLAYGDFTDPRLGVEPGSAVVFEVELASVEIQQPLTSDIIMVPSAEQLKAGSNIMVIKQEDLKNMTNAAPK